MNSTGRPAVALAAILLLLAAAFAGGIAYFKGRDATSAQQALDQRQRAAVEGIIESYLVENPEVLVRAMNALQAKRQLSEEQRLRDTLARHAKVLYEDDPRFNGGNLQGDVTIVEFFDYQCGYCKRVFPKLMKVLAEDGNVRIVFKDIPILGPVSVLAAKAAIAAARQDKYEAMHKVMMGAKFRLNEARIMGIAEGLGLDMERFRADMKAPETQALIDRNLALAQALGINGTPAFVIGRRLIPGAIGEEDFVNLIAEARRAAEGS